MLVTLKEIMKIAEERKIAIGAFNGTTLEGLTAIIEAAEEMNTPVVLQHAQVHDAVMPMETIAPIMIDMAKKAKVPVCVHLDHGTSFKRCMEALRLGFTSVMIDASDKDYEENIAITSKVVEIAHDMGASVEAELGHILVSEEGADEGGITQKNVNPDDCYTDPKTAKDFVERTGVDALAIAFGTAHGVYVTKPVLDLDRITKIKEKIDIPFVMHGGSGVSEEEFKTAIKNGIRKINYYTYMAMAGANAVLELTNGKNKEDHLQFHDMAIAAKQGMKENVKEAMRIFMLK